MSVAPLADAAYRSQPLPAAPFAFRDLIAPFSPQDFFRNHYRQRHLHVPGKADKAERVLSWQVINDLLAMTTIWSDHNCELAADGVEVPKDAYCYRATDRNNEPRLRPDYRRLREQLSQGATLALNFIERLTPELRALDTSMEMVLQAPANITAFVSWKGAQGYMSHFDTPNVFALQVSGRKVWNVYKGRHPNAAHTEGARFGDYPPEHHQRAKGEVLAEIEMKPGDLLYIPHGQYHDALAADDHSLHLSIVVRHMLVHDFVKQLVDDLPQDPFFRQHVPPADAAGAGDAMRAQTAQHLQQVLSQPAIGQGLQDFLKGKAYENVAEMNLPTLGQPQQFRVRWLGRELSQTDSGCRITSGAESVAFEHEEALLARFCFERDHVTSDMIEALPLSLPTESRAIFLQQLVRLGLLEPL